jgi:hypothetical protein
VERTTNESKRKDYGKAGEAEDLYELVMMLEENTETEIKDEWKQWK